jgi:hypothetical protein
MAPAGVACGVGMFLFGYAMEVGANAILCAFLQGVMNVGVLLGIFSTLSYGLDGFRRQSNEIFIMNMFFKVCLRPQRDNVSSNKYYLEFHVLRSEQFREQLGRCEWTCSDLVCLWRHILVPGCSGDSGLHIWQEVAELVGQA